MNEKWVEIRKSGNYKELGDALGVSPVVARIIRNRGLNDIEAMKDYLNPSEKVLHDGDLLYGMGILNGVMSKKIRDGKRIRIIGDYDVDGISSTYILFKGLSFLGADCDYTVPHRIEDGYGINIKLIDDAHAAGTDTIITCDNGIAARDQALHATELGMTMVITDHHEVPYEIIDGEKRFLLPNADAIVDPKLPQDEYPFKGICGAVVALKVIISLARFMGKDDSPEFRTLLEEFYEFAALATVCDVMELTDENRSIVKMGLKYMAHSKNKGLRALIKATGIEDRALTPYHAGFIIGPCLNATGRLDSSLKALSLLCETDEAKCEALATELKELNEERKEMTVRESEKAINQVLESPEIDKVLVVYLPECHESLAGIIAGKVRERFQRPTFVLTKTVNGLKGSGRSIEAYNMFEGLTAVSEELTKFGGHKLAAGISLPEDRLDSFKKKLNDNCDLKEDDFRDTVHIDMELPFVYATLNLSHELEMLEPLGVGNETPQFARTGVNFISGQIMGKNRNVAKYRISDGDGHVYDLISFGGFEEIEELVGEIYGKEKKELFHTGRPVNVKLDIVYRLSINTYMGRESAQLQLKYFR